MPEKAKSIRKVDIVFMLCTFALVGLGIVIIYSSSGAYAESRGLSSSFYLITHLKKVLIAFLALFAGLSINYRSWEKLARPMFFLALGLLLFLVTSSSITGVHGAKRWISIASFGLQPSELAKLALIFFLARLLTKKEDVLHRFKEGLLSSLIMVAIVFVLVMAQPDYSTALTIASIAAVLIFAAGARISHLLSLSLILVPILGYLMLSSPYRLRRVMAFLHPEDNMADSYQSLQALISLGNGGIFGTGLGTSTQKLGYLPMPFTDTIFSILGEEAGFAGTTICLFLFGIIIWRGLSISYQCPDKFGSLVALGITTSIGVNVIMHVGVCAGFFPTTGQPLPFVSFGGTALCVTMFLSGVILNISGVESSRSYHYKQVTRKLIRKAMINQRLHA